MSRDPVVWLNRYLLWASVCLWSLVALGIVIAVLGDVEALSMSMGAGIVAIVTTGFLIYSKVTDR